MSYILVMYIYANILAKGDSVTMQAVDGFKTMAACQSAGKLAEPLVEGSAKTYRFTCLARPQ